MLGGSNLPSGMRHSTSHTTKTARPPDYFRDPTSRINANIIGRRRFSMNTGNSSIATGFRLMKNTFEIDDTNR